MPQSFKSWKSIEEALTNLFAFQFIEEGMDHEQLLINEILKDKEPELISKTSPQLVVILFLQRQNTRLLSRR